jgi:SAM-dependent methyltransferase
MRESLQRAYRPLLARVYRPPLRGPLLWRYRGDRVTCPVCEGQFAKFMPRIKPSGPNRPGARCPGCGASERHRHLWLYLARRRDLFTEPLRVLHFAPEPRISKRLRRLSNLDYVSADLNSPRAMIKADITKLQFDSASFDVVICSHVLEHVPDDHGALLEIRRVLRPGGWAVILVPIDRGRSQTFEDPSIVTARDRERTFGQSDHVRVYGRDFPERLGRAGFEVHDASLQASLGADLVARHGLKPHDKIFVIHPRPTA